ncbi:MAG TPA: TonB family protein [Terriglobales bacterium]|nr:TonB family protein [Terriglobales bacterium]
MFEDSLIESGNRLKTHRGRMAAISFGLQAILVGVLVLIPLLITEALPKQQLTTFLVAPPPPPPPPPPAAPVHIVRQVQTDIVNNQLRTPTRIPQKVQMIKEDAAPPMQGVMGGVVGGVPGGSAGGVIGSIVSSTNVKAPTVAAPQRIRVSSGVSTGNLIRKITPQYPSIARTAHISGSVILEAEISKEGDVVNLHVIGGPPLLRQAAIDAVKQWKYRPYLLNGEPVVVDTQVTVIFSLGG